MTSVKQAENSNMEQESGSSSFRYEICPNWDIKWQFNVPSIPIQDEEQTQSSLLNQSQQKYMQISNLSTSEETVEWKLEEALRKLECSYYEKRYNNNSTSTTPIVPRSEQKRIKSIRKITEKTIKAFKMRLSDISKELQEDKNSMKLWFRKKLDSPEDNARILEKCRKWIHNKFMKIDFEDFLKIIHKYTKSFQKEEAKRFKIADPSTIQKKSFVMCPTPPGESNSRNSNLLLYQTDNGEIASNLVHIDIEMTVKGQPRVPLSPQEMNDNNGINFLNQYYDSAGNYIPSNKNTKKNTENIKTSENYPSESQENIVIRDKILWDVSLSDSQSILSNSYHFVKDFIAEQKLQNITKLQIQDLWISACKQIQSQLQDRRILQESQKAICQFNSSEMITIQKEHLILINLLLKNRQQQIIHKETIEWDIMQDSNSAESFAEILVQDLNLDKSYVSEIARQIRDQIIDYLASKAEKIGRFYPEFNKNTPTENWNRVKEKEFMKKKLVLTMNEEIPHIPENYQSEDFPVFQNQEMFNLIKNNIDIMPPKFQEKLIVIQKIEFAQKTRKENESPFINIDKAMRCLDPALILQDNPYIPQILRENRHINDLELELDKKRAIFNNPLLAAQMN